MKQKLIEIAVPLTVVMEDSILHTDEYPYCLDQTCPCHENTVKDLARIAVEQSQATRAEVQAFLDQATLRRKRMARQEATGFTVEEREALAETEIPFLFDLPETEQEDGNYD